jgi:hypothetical protein
MLLLFRQSLISFVYKYAAEGMQRYLADKERKRCENLCTYLNAPREVIWQELG